MAQWFTLTPSRSTAEGQGNYYYYYSHSTGSSRTNWVSRHQKDKPFWVVMKQEVIGDQWH